MTVLASLLALAISVAGLVYLTATDPKRRRSFRLSARPRFAIVGWIVAIAPGAALLVAGETAAFLIWIAAATIVGWLLAARPPAANPAPDA